MNKLIHYRRNLLLLAMLSTAFARAQTSFDPKGGCLNVVDISHGQKLSEYGDKCKICCSIEHIIKEMLLSKKWTRDRGKVRGM